MSTCWKENVILLCPIFDVDKSGIVQLDCRVLVLGRYCHKLSRKEPLAIFAVGTGCVVFDFDLGQTQTV